MRTRTMILTGALLLVFAGAAQAQQDAGSRPRRQPPAAADVPTLTPFRPKLGRSTSASAATLVTGDAARYQRFRDLRDGRATSIGSASTKETRPVGVPAPTANNVGYRDQRYYA